MHGDAASRVQDGAPRRRRSDGGGWSEAPGPAEAHLRLVGHEEWHGAQQPPRGPQLGGVLVPLLLLRVRCHRCVRLDADGVQAGAVQRQGRHVGVVAVGARRVEPQRAPGQRALPPVRVLVPAQRLRAEELALAVVAREHARRLAGDRRRVGRRAAAVTVVGSARLGGGGGGDGEREVEAYQAGGVGRLLAADLGQLVARFLAHLLAVHP
uniref:Uncharacterized protein n=1 Tax=Zea mays TaxID=4577 RepID=A0A804LGV6_MAIZE